MKDEYLYWKRYVDNIKAELESAEVTILLQTPILAVAEAELKKRPKPKLPPLQGT